MRAIDNRFVRGVLAMLVGAGWAASAAGGPIEPMTLEKLYAQVPLVPWAELRTPGERGQMADATPGLLESPVGRVIRIQGYLVSQPGAQDSCDLLVTPRHPETVACGPEPGSAIETYFPDVETFGLPGHPVEVWGRLELAKHSRFGPYRFRAVGWTACSTPDDEIDFDQGETRELWNR